MRRALAAPLLLSLACAAAPPVPTPASIPAPVAPRRPLPMWEVRTPGQPGVLHLLGSVYLLPGTDAELDQILARQLAATDRVVVEVDPSAQDPAAATAMIQARGLLPPEQTLSASLSRGTAEALRQRGQELGLAPSTFERMRPWMAALALTSVKLRLDGYGDARGIDRSLADLARAQGKPVQELERLEDQVALLETLTPEQQEALLLDALFATAPDRNANAALSEAYLSGDPGRIEAVALETLRAHLELAPLYEVIVFQRNRALLPALRALLQERGSALAVIGVEHLVGPRGLVALLRDAGCQVQQVEAPTAAGTAPRQAEAPAWHTVRDPERGFTASFPGEPRVEERSFGAPGKTTQITKLRYEQEGLALVVHLVALPDGDEIATADEAEVLESATEAWARVLGGEVLSSQVIALGGQPARRVELQLPGAHLQGLLVYRRGLLYQVHATVAAEVGPQDPRRGVAVRFLDSFALMPPEP